jgi:hypothetical protein
MFNQRLSEGWDNQNFSLKIYVLMTIPRNVLPFNNGGLH